MTMEKTLLAVRDDFPILATRVHRDRPLVFLDNAASTQRPRQVIAAMSDFYESRYANVHRGVHWLSQRASDDYEAARKAVARFIGASSIEEVIFTSGTTMSVNLVARAWGETTLRSGDEILLTEMEHHANIVPWQQVAARTGATVRFLPITDAGQLRLDCLGSHLSPRTKIVSVTAVSNVLGTINPVAEIVNAAREVGAVTMVDAAQHVPHDKTNVGDWGADFVVFSGHKMLGPTGIGVLWGRREILDRMPPFLGGGSMITEVTTAGYRAAPVPARFEAGTPPIAEAVGLAAAIEYLERLGMDRVRAHEHALVERAYQRLSEVSRVRILGPDVSERAGIVSFEVQGLHAQDVCTFLDLKGFALRAGHHCAMPLHERLGVSASSRASFYLYNTLAEVDAFADALEQVIERYG